MTQSFKVARDDTDIRLDRWFRRHYAHIPVVAIQKACRKGLIRIDGTKAKPEQRVQTGQEISVKYLDLQSQESVAKPVTLSASQIEEARHWVLYENDRMIVLNKPAGLAVQGGSGVRDHLDLRLSAFEPRPKLVHRLDKDTSGCIVLAKGASAAAHYTKLFREDEISKTYLAILSGVPIPMEGQIESRMQKSGEIEKMKSGERGKIAITDYEVLDYAQKRAALVALKPITGRTHQLRVHMAEMECPILSDGKYGGKEAFIEGMEIPKQLHLHAWKVSVEGQEFEAPLPKHVQQSMKKLGLQFKAKR